MINYIMLLLFLFWIIGVCIQANFCYFLMLVLKMSHVKIRSIDIIKMILVILLSWIGIFILAIDFKKH